MELSVVEQVKGQSLVAASGGGAAQTPSPGPVTLDKSGAVTITVHAKPGSKLSSITGRLHTLWTPALLVRTSHSLLLLL